MIRLLVIIVILVLLAYTVKEAMRFIARAKLEDDLDNLEAQDDALDMKEEIMKREKEIEDRKRKMEFGEKEIVDKEVVRDIEDVLGMDK